MSIRRTAHVLVVLAGLALAAGTLDCGRAHHVMAPPETAYGTLAVESTPSGAEVVIDGRDMHAVTPDDFTLTEGVHVVRLVRAATTFQPESLRVTVPAENSVTATFLEYAPILVPASDTHAFGTQDLGTAGTPWCVTLTNTGLAPADSGTFALAGPGADQWSILSGARHDAIAPGATIELCVQFRPTRRGEHAASIALGRRSITLTGTGHEVPCALVASAGAHAFGACEVGSRSETWCFDVTNHDASTCRDTLELTGANADAFAITTGAVLNLAPGATQGVCVEFRPRAPGAASATIAIGDGQVVLGGTGTGECRIETPRTPDGTDFGTVCTQSPVSKRLVVPNTGSLPCTVHATGCGPFAVAPAEAVVPAHGEFAFAVTFTAQDSGPAADCPVTVSGDAGTWSVSFAGAGKAPPLADFEPSGGIAAHAGVPVSFTARVQSNGAPVTSYLWDFGDGETDNGPNPTHTYRKGGSYIVTLTAANECGNSPTAENLICIDEPASVIIYNFADGAVPDYTTNVPGWGTTVPLVLYRGPHVLQTSLASVVCGNVIEGERLETGHDNWGVAFGAAEALGTSGQSFATALLPMPRTECGATVTISWGSPAATYTIGPAPYVKLGACEPQYLGNLSPSPLYCIDQTYSGHCGQPGLDGRLEWGLRAQATPSWITVENVRITYDCWYVCPQSETKHGKLTVVDAH